MSDGNREGVRRAALVAIAMMGIALFACNSPVKTPSAGEPGSTTLVVTNHVARPFEVERLVVDIDGRPLTLSAIPPGGAAPTILARLRLPAGEHELALVGTVRQRAAADRVVVARSDQTLEIGDAPALVALELSMREGGEGLDIAVRLEGATAVDPNLARRSGDATCPRRPHLRNVVCRAELRLGDAQRRGDPAYLYCVRDALAALRAISDVAPPQPTPTNEAGRDELYSEATRWTESRIAALERDLDRCSPVAEAP